MIYIVLRQGRRIVVSHLKEISHMGDAERESGRLPWSWNLGLGLSIPRISHGYLEAED